MVPSSLRTDNPQEMLSVIRVCKIGRDVEFDGELARWRENPGLRIHYFSANGCTVDELGERIYDRGLLNERPSPVDVLDLLEQLFSPVMQRRARSEYRAADNAAVELSRELERAQKNRNLKWNCACGRSPIRSARTDLRLTCGYCGAAVVRHERTAREVANDAPLAMIQAPDYCGDFDNVPF